MKLYYFIINVLKSIIFVNLIFRLLLEYSVFEIPLLKCFLKHLPEAWTTKLELWSARLPSGLTLGFQGYNCDARNITYTAPLRCYVEDNGSKRMKAPPYDQSSLWKMASPFIEDPGAGAQIMRGVLTLLSCISFFSLSKPFRCVFVYRHHPVSKTETLWPCTCGSLLITYESTTLK